VTIKRFKIGIHSMQKGALMSLTHVAGLQVTVIDVAK